MPNEALPALSVVVPTLGRHTVVPTVLSLLAAGEGCPMEVILVGRIHDVEVCGKISDLVKDHRCLKHLSLSFEKGDSSEKKNAGFRESRASIVAFVDDDVVVRPEWPRRILDVFQDPGVGLVSGPSLVPEDISLVERLAGLSLASKGAGYASERYLTGSSLPRAVKWSRIIGCNMAYRRTVLEGIGGFDPAFWPGEEMIAAFKATRLGHTLIFDPRASLYHYPRTTVWRFVRQIYGYGATRVRLDRAGVEFEVTTLVPALWVLSLILLGVSSPFWSVSRWLLLVGLTLYGVFDGMIVVAKFRETRKPADLLLFLFVPLMHLSYGIGEWAEWFRPEKDLSENIE